MYWVVLNSVLISLFFKEISGNNGRIINISLKKHHNNSLENIKEQADNLNNHAASGNISLLNIENVYYYGPLQIGTPPQDLTVLFSTAINLLTVPSNEICKNDPTYCLIHNTYSHNLSCSYQNEGEYFNITWGAGKTSGGISGVYAQDNIQVGGLNVTGQQFGEMMYVSDSVKVVLFDGLFGLAFPNPALNITPPLINMLEQGLLEEPVFAFYLNKVGDGQDAELVLGGKDPTHYTGSFTFTPIINSSLWKIHTGGLYMSKTPIVPPIPAVVSTGTTFLLGPWEYFEILNQVIGGTEYEDTGLYSLDCSTVGTLPQFSFLISNEYMSLGPEDYVFSIFTASGETCLSGFLGVKNIELFVLGDIFMQKYYTLFDMGNRQVGFASANIPSPATAPVQTTVTTAAPPRPTSTSNANPSSISTSIIVIVCFILTL